MRNDARPIGEKLGEIDEHARHERGLEHGPREHHGERARDMSEGRPFVTDRDTGDEEKPRPESSRTH